MPSLSVKAFSAAKIHKTAVSYRIQHIFCTPSTKFSPKQSPCEILCNRLAISVLAVSFFQTVLGTFLQQLCNNAPAAPEQCSRGSVSLLRGCWNKVTEPPVKCAFLIFNFHTVRYLKGLLCCYAPHYNSIIGTETD